MNINLHSHALKPSGNPSQKSGGHYSSNRGTNFGVKCSTSIYRCDGQVSAYFWSCNLYSYLQWLYMFLYSSNRLASHIPVEICPLMTMYISKIPSWGRDYLWLPLTKIRDIHIWNDVSFLGLSHRTDSGTVHTCCSTIFFSYFMHSLKTFLLNNFLRWIKSFPDLFVSQTNKQTNPELQYIHNSAAPEKERTQPRLNN